MEAKTGRNRKVISVALFGFSLFYFLSSLGLKMGTPKKPGPGFLPVGIGALLILCTAFQLFRAFWGRPDAAEASTPAQAVEKKDYRAVIGILVCTVLYPVILESAKFLIATFVVTFLMLVLLKPRQAVGSFFLALGMSVAAFLVFARLLGVGLPSGFLEVLMFRIGG